MARKPLSSTPSRRTDQARRIGSNSDSSQRPAALLCPARGLLVKYE